MGHLGLRVDPLTKQSDSPLSPCALAIVEGQSGRKFMLSLSSTHVFLPGSVLSRVLNDSVLSFDPRLVRLLVVHAV